MARIFWVDDDQADGPLAELFAAWKAKNPGRDRMPDILKSFTARPDFLRNVMDFSYGVHFQDGHLTRRLKEMIATYVSALNQCVY